MVLQLQSKVIHVVRSLAPRDVGQISHFNIPPLGGLQEPFRLRVCADDILAPV